MGGRTVPRRGTTVRVPLSLFTLSSIGNMSNYSKISVAALFYSSVFGLSSGLAGCVIVLRCSTGCIGRFPQFFGALWCDFVSARDISW